MYTNTMKPILAISLGDPAGISPEIVAKNLPEASTRCNVVVFGHWPSLEQALEMSQTIIGIDLKSEPSPSEDGRVAVVHCGPDGESIDKPCEGAASAQCHSLKMAADAVIDGKCDALVTAPVSKSQVAQIWPEFTGHTEYLARRASVPPEDVTMVFASKTLSVGLVSTHLPLRDSSEQVKRPRLERTLRHLKQIFSSLEPGRRPRIGVAALNPHAGEGGLLGTEEADVIAPFCREFDGDDVELIGPVPADVLFRDAFNGEYNGVISMYHDQAMIPLKLRGIARTVNVTMGLPFIRTSPDHGVAYDIARTDMANPSGMKLAIELATELRMAGI
jgi:4-hydroxythreonine-4-phosphate dehydrogenase